MDKKNYVVSRVINGATTAPVQAESVQHLAQMITEIDWSHGVFDNNHRKEANFVSADVIALDIDKGLSLVEALERFKEFKHIIITTRNHQLSKNGESPQDRFRVVLFPDRQIKGILEYRTTWIELSKKYPFIDQSCKDASRFWYKGKDIVSVNNSGSLIPVAETQCEPCATFSPKIDLALKDKGYLSHKTREIIQNGLNAVGERNIGMFKAAVDFRQNNYTKEEMLEALSGKSTLSEKEERAALENGFERNPKYPPRIPEAKPQRIPTEDWVYTWLQENEARLNIKTAEVTILDRSIGLEVLIARIILDADRVQAKYGEEKIKHALTLWKRSQYDAVIQKYRSELAFDSTVGDKYISQFLLAVTGKTDELDVLAIKHFVWQVKRKLIGLPVVEHLMPILVGKTRAGKTEAIKALLKPIDELYRSPQDMTVINDERGIRILHDAFCIFFDEMAKADKVDVDRLKNVITAPTVTYRVMRTNHTSTVTNNATFIGAANHTIKDLIYDPTSARRFWQINTLDVIDWNVINSLDYRSLWKSVDEMAVGPILSVIKRINDIQNKEFRNMSQVEEWIMEYCDVLPDETHNDQLYSRDELYTEFKKWLVWQGCRQIPKANKFSDQIKAFKKRSEGNTAYYEVNGKCFIRKRIDDGNRYNLKPRQGFWTE